MSWRDWVPVVGRLMDERDGLDRVCGRWEASFEQAVAERDAAQRKVSLLDKHLAQSRRVEGEQRQELDDLRKKLAAATGPGPAAADAAELADLRTRAAHQAIVIEQYEDGKVRLQERLAAAEAELAGLRRAAGGRDDRPHPLDWAAAPGGGIGE